MVETENINEQKKTFFKDLLDRRIPQILGFYFAGSWGVLQFSDWIVDRYLLSPYCVELLITIIASLLPSVIVVAYYHGKPGKNRWKKIEKVLIPLNIVLAFLLVFILFSHKNLDSIAHRVTAKDEAGKKIERVVPKKKSIKKVLLFYFDNKSKNKSLDWISYGSVYMLDFDLQQDPFINTFHPGSQKGIDLDHYIFRKIKENGFEKGLNLPVMLKKKIAEEINSEYFLCGDINKEKDDFIISLTLHKTKTTEVVLSKKIKSNSLFDLIDKVSLFLKKGLDLPSYKNDKFVDLPLKETFTKSIKAAKHFSEAINIILISYDWIKAQELLEKAVKEDSTFIVAYSRLAGIYLMNKKIKKWKSVSKTLMKYLYKLPEKSQFYFKANYYNVLEQPKKSLSIFEMLTKLYPNDMGIMTSYAKVLFASGEYEKAINLYKKMLEADPSRYDLYKTIGEIYNLKGDLTNSLIFYKKYLDKFPTNIESFLKVGKIAEKTGRFQDAKEYYDKALLLKPENSTILGLIAGMYMKTGDFSKALDSYKEALDFANTFKEKGDIYSSLSRYYSIKGENQKALEYHLLSMEMKEKFMSPFTVLIIKTITITKYIEAGKSDEAFKILESYKSQLLSPFDNILSLGYLLVNIKTGKPDKAIKYIDDIQKFVDKTGVKQIVVFKHWGLGDIKKLKKKYKEAIEHYKEALKFDPNDYGVLKSIAFCHRKLKNYEQAKMILEKILKTNPFNPKIIYEKAMLYWDMGKKEESLLLVNKTLDVWKNADPNYDFLIKAKDLKNKLKGSKEK